MPQKKNPDTAELVRGKTGRVVGHLVGMLMVLKGLPLTYNSDLQEDKEGLFDTVDTLAACLETMAGTVSTLKFNRERAAQAAGRGFSTATELADYLVVRGLPFRQAHAVVGRLVRTALERGVGLDELDIDDLRSESQLFAPDALELLRPETAVARRTSPGGTAPELVTRELARARALLYSRTR